MPPSLATYQQAAESIYNPQQQAETNTLTANRDAEVNQLNTQKGQVQTDYGAAVTNLRHQVESETGNINQLYNTRLIGNFSGLQGNDLGQLYSRANEQTQVIESTRANKLAEIGAQVAGTTTKYNTEINNLGLKYRGLKEKYSQDAYGSAVKDYNEQQYRQQQLSLSYARINAENARAAAAAASRASRGSGRAARAPTQNEIAQSIRSGLNSVRGRDGYVAPQDYGAAFRDWVNAGYSSASFDSNFGDLMNPSNGYYQYAKSRA